MKTPFDFINSQSPIPYVKNFLTQGEADALFAFLQTTPYIYEPNKRNGGASNIRKRLYGTYVRDPLNRTKIAYGGPPIDILTAPAEIQVIIRKLSAYAGKAINYISILGYADGREHIFFHNHKEDFIEEDQSVYVISLGHVRALVVRPIGCTDRSQYITIMPEHGSLYVLPHAFNATHEHEIPNSKFRCGLRISLNAKCEGDQPPPKKKSNKKFVRQPGPPRIYNASGQHPADAVYAGRGWGKDFPPSPYGNYNKHALKTDEGRVAWTREVTEKLLDPAFRIQLETLRGKDLICHCSPKEIKAGECHAMWWLARANAVAL